MATEATTTYKGDFVLTGGVSENLLKGGIDKSGELSVWKLDIAQSRYFTIQLRTPDGISSKAHFANYKCPGGKLSDFLPVKNMSLNTCSVDTKTVPVHIFSDFPLIDKRKVGRILLTCYDEDDDHIERAYRRWLEDECFIGTRVRYLSKMYKELIYTSYDVTGKKNFHKKVFVIPDGSITVDRNYENEAKLITISLAIVGEDGASVKTGKGSTENTVPSSRSVIKEDTSEFNPLKDLKVMSPFQ